MNGESIIAPVAANPFRIAFTRCAFPFLALFTLNACHARTRERTSVTDQTSSARIDGVWQMDLRIERPMSFSADGKSLPRSVGGTLALLKNRVGPAVAADIMKAATHTGVYDLDLVAIGLPAAEGGNVPSVAARIVRADRPTSSGAAGDSIILLLNPDLPARAIRLSGVIADDVVRGVWVAESPLGGGGSFVLRRRDPTSQSADSP